jgi:hypothetical protein
MATKGQTHAKRDRERALRERRERKQAKKAEAAAQRASGNAPDVGAAEATSGAEGHAETAAIEWIQ